MGNTEAIIRETALKTKGAAPVLLRGTLWVSGGVLGVLVKTLYEWKTRESAITTLDVQILIAVLLWEMAKTWLTYLDSSFSQWKEEKKEERRKLTETEFMRQQTGAKT